MPGETFLKQLRIERIIQETPESRTFVLQPADWSPVYKAGQFITLVFNTRHGERRRSYSISSAPALQEPLSISVKKIDNGEFSRQLVYDAREGDVLLTSGIGGQFILPEDKEQADRYFFIAAGSGIVPGYAIIKTLLATTQQSIVLIYSNKTEQDAMFYASIIKLQETYPNRFIIRFLFSDRLDVHHSRLSNWLLLQMLDDYAKGYTCNFFVCGPYEYMRTVEITLLTRFPKEKIYKENFNTLPRIVIPRPPDINAHNVLIRFMDEEYNLSVQYPYSILAVAKSRNIQLPYSCEAGRCSSCVANCLSGKVWMAYNEVLTDDEIEKGRVLLCQGFPVGGDVVISL